MNKFKGYNITIAILFLLLFSECSSKKAKANNKIAFADNCVVAHRGAWKKMGFPENSIASLKHAIELKCTGSEFDVRMTADDSLVINHDPHYNNLPIESTAYTDLLKFKLSNGEKLPTLREYVLAGIENNISTRLVCEIKPSEISKERGQIVAAKVVQLVKELKAQDIVVYISFDYDILKKIRTLNPTVSLQYLEGNKSPEQVKADGISGLDCHFSVFKEHPDWIESAKKNNITLNAWTVNDPNDMDWLIANGFDFITTNEPELLKERIKLSPVSNGMKLIWSDEFNTKGLPDSTKWNFEEGGHGWGNGESQYYTSRPENANIQNGILSIKIIKENYKGSSYTSARINTKNKFSFKYGKVEMRAKQPSGGGVWPALWMLGDNKAAVGWPACGEIDIMEYAGNRMNKVTAALHHPDHSGANPDGGYTMITNADTEFHIYTLEWTPSDIKISVDNQHFFVFANSSSIPFNHDFFLIFNCAIGGHYGGAIDPNFSSSNFDIDYVRVFQNK
ncbi:family 16 glycosylhydrolase [uncultured Flavobacterium sp.]|uniref:glycerophosphodiester phosphodiesterase family protein n=1 Tax=uncultured Flavobacterium sp. TaxID=165435 RepID=UPI0030CA23E6